MEAFAAFWVLILYPLGTSGALVREGLITKRALRKARQNAQEQGVTVTPRWYVANRKATLYILGPIVGWTIAYVVLFRLLSSVNAPTGVYVLLSLPLIPVFLGGLGIVFKPIEDLGDYFPFDEEDRQARRTKMLVSKILNKLSLSLVSGDRRAIGDQVAFLSFIDDLVKHNPNIKPGDLPQVKGKLLNELNEKVYTRLVSLMSKKDQQELDRLLDDIPSNKELDEFLVRKVPNMEREATMVLAKFRSDYLEALKQPEISRHDG